MPVLLLKTAVTILNQFVAHWQTLENEPGLAAVVLPVGYTIDNLVADRAALETAIIAQESFDNRETVAMSTRDALKAALVPRLLQFRKIVGGLLSGSAYAERLPTLPKHTVSPGKFLAPFNDAANLWQQINAAPPPGFSAPLVLPVGYGFGNYSSELSALAAAFKKVDDTALNAALARSRRDALIAPIETRLKQYRIAVHAVLPMDSPLLKTVPRFTPPRKR